jgi:hypothetical protein
VLAELAGVLRGVEVVIVAGNHDHALLAGWRARRSAAPDSPAPLGLEQRLTPAEASWPARALAEALPTAAISMAYPGVWLGERVYATHGHYLDCHSTLPTLERLGAGLMTRLLGALPAGRLEPEDYEARLDPIYAWIHAVAQHRDRHRFASDGGSARAWKTLSAPGRRPLRARALTGLLPLGIRALNRAGLGPLRADLSPAEVRRVGTRAMAQVVSRLGIDADHVIFGHTHRAGPLAQEPPVEWRAGDAALVNSGCWVFEPGLLARGPDSPFWPGTCVVLDGSAPPVLSRLLGGSAATGPRPA